MIVDHALELTEREGASALTMRRLGDELGVDPTAVYRHFRDKDDLILACLDRIVGQTYDEVAPTIEALDWRDLLRRIAQECYAMCLSHPAIFTAAFYRTTGGPGERRIVELILRTLSGLGLSRAETVLYYRTFVDVMLGMCGTRAAVHALGPQLAEKDNTAWARIYARLPHDDFPAAREHGAELSSVSPEEIYTAATESVIALIAERVRQLAL